MAAKRITGSTFNWAELSKRVPEAQKSNYVAFKTKSDNYLRKMLAYPENPPKIDWSFYKARIAVAGMVDDFQKRYDALTIPYPKDTQSAEIDQLKAEAEKNIKQFIEESNARIVKHKEEIKRIEEMIPYALMTMEEFYEAHPDQAIDPVNNPTFFPHNPEDQLTAEDLEERRRSKLMPV